MQSRPHAVSQREPSASGPRRLPARQRDRRPGSLHITPSCAATGCRAVTPPATRPSRSGGGQAARQLAGIPHARRPLAPLQNIRRGSPKTPTHPGCSPPPSPGGCAKISAGAALASGLSVQTWRSRWHAEKRAGRRPFRPIAGPQICRVSKLPFRGLRRPDAELSAPLPQYAVLRKSSVQNALVRFPASGWSLINSLSRCIALA